VAFFVQVGQQTTQFRCDLAASIFAKKLLNFSQPSAGVRVLASVRVNIRPLMLNFARIVIIDDQDVPVLILG
jgi:hypothetical protein